jgi:hypothetical protein
MVEKLSTATVLSMIDNGVPTKLALEQCGFKEVSEETIQKLEMRSSAARIKVLQSLYTAANDRRSTPSQRAKALEMWDKMSKEGAQQNQNITIVINGEKETL